MMIKRALASGEDFGVHLLNPGRMTKVAGMLPLVEEFTATLRPDPKFIYTLVNAMGYSEFYGPNSNRDWYGHNEHLDFNGLLHTPENCGHHGEYNGWQKDAVVQARVAKTWPFGYPSFYGASVYAHHKNTDPTSLGFGDVVFAAQNEAMKRIELVMQVDIALAEQRGQSAILNRIARGDRVDVSMGCFQAGAKVTLADGTRKSIEDIKVGDRVRTHTGGTGRVTELHRRRYRGEFFEIKPANEDSFVATVEHPFFAAYGAKDVHRGWESTKPAFDWVFAKDLGGAVLSRPKVLKTIDTEYTREHARILGYYLAEGHVVFARSGKPAGIELTVNNSDYVNTEISQLCESIGTRNAPVWRQRENSEEASAIGIYDPAVAEFCAQLGGRYSKTKKLAEEVLYWPRELQLEFLGAYFNGDGHGVDGTLSCSTASEDLAHQVREILHRLGIPASYQLLHHKAGSGKSQVDTYEWVVFMGRQWVPQLAGYCAKVEVREVGKAKNIYRDYGDLWAVPIREYESFFDEADVYNFEVEGDNSYLVNGVASHNCKVPFDLCSICTDWDAVKAGWKGYDKLRHSSPGIAILAYHRTQKPIRGLAVTKADYCEHMVGMPGAILPDGQKVFVYNDFPKFFDISFVWVGADRTARVMWHMGSPGMPGLRQRPTSLSELMKGASDMTKIAGVPVSEKSAEIDKEVTGGITRKIELCANDEVDLPFGPLAEFSKAFGAKTLLSTLAGLGVPLKPQEFHAVISVEHPLQDKIAKMALEHHMTFKTSLPGYSSTYAVDAEHFSEKLAQQLLPLLEGRSSFAPYLHYRLAMGQKTASARVPQLIDAIFVHDVAAAYNGYRGSLLKAAASLFPKYYSVVPLSPGDMMKNASSAGLLLSSHTVVHWISAHLEKVADAEEEVGSVMKYVMASPEYSRLSAFGTELCQRMDSRTNFLSALKMAATTVL